MASKGTSAHFGEEDFFGVGQNIGESQSADIGSQGLSLDTVLRVVAVALGIAVGIVFVAALVYPLFVPSPSKGRVAAVEVGPGVYLVAHGQLAKLDPRRGMDSEVQSESPKVRTVDSLVVVARHAADPSRYRLRRVGSGEPDVRQCRVSVSEANGLVRITLHPGRLPAGLYELSLPRDSVFGGEECVFLNVVP